MTDQFPDLYKGRLSSPFNANVVDSTTGNASDIWEAHFQSLTDTINNMVNTDLKGVTDGSEATAGDVGEYLTETGSASLTTNVTVTVATLTLTAGDWDVTGGVTFTITSAASSLYAAGFDGAFGQAIAATIPTGSGTWVLSAGGPVRRNVSASTDVTLVAMARFTSGSVSAAGTISARRMR